MKYCINCGQENEDDSIFCINCGKRVDEAENYDRQINQRTADNIVSTGKDVVGKVASGAKKAMKQVTQKLANEREKINRDVEKMSERYEAERKDKFNRKEISGSEYMSKTELWSWLKRQSERHKYFTEEKSTLSFNGFIDKVNNKIKENEVPASLSIKKIQWDRGNVSQNVCYVKPNTSAANPLTRLIQFQHVGKFTFVEEKTFITPPDLPEIPKKKLIISSWMKNWIFIMLIGILMAVGGGINHKSNDSMGVLFFCGIGFILFGIYSYVNYQAMVKHNRLCVKQEKAWNDAWNNWHETIFIYAFQEDINGRLSRIFDAVSACVKQVSEEEFKDALASSVKEEESTNMNELEEMIKRRQEEYR